MVLSPIHIQNELNIMYHQQALLIPNRFYQLVWTDCHMTKQLRDRQNTIEA